MLLRIPVPACAGVVAGASRTPPPSSSFASFGSVPCAAAQVAVRGQRFSPCSIGRSCPDRTYVACVPLTCLPHRWPQTGALKATGCFLPQSWATGVRCRSCWAAATLPLGRRPPPMAGCRGAPQAPPALAAASLQAPPLTARLLLLFGVCQARLCFPPRREACS